MKWAEMSTEERNALIHEQVMGIDPHTPCADTAHYHEEARYWHCSGCDKHWLQQPEEPHTKEIPPYTTSMDAARQAVKHVYMSTKRSDLYFFLEDVIGDDWEDILNVMNLEDRLCFAALKACGVEIEQEHE